MRRAGLLLAAAVAPMAAPREDEALARFRARQQEIASRPFYAVATMRVRRGRHERELRVRFHYRSRSRALVKVEGPPREHGNVILLDGDRVHALFAKASLTLTAQGLGSMPGRLFGTDFAAEDLFTIGCDFGAFGVVATGPAGQGLTRVDLVPVPSAPLPRWDAVSLWLRVTDGTLARAEYRSVRRRLWRLFDCTAPPDSKLPTGSWRARSPSTARHRRARRR